MVTRHIYALLSCLMMGVELLSPLVIGTIWCLIVISLDADSELSTRTKQAQRPLDNYTAKAGTD